MSPGRDFFFCLKETHTRIILDNDFVVFFFVAHGLPDSNHVFLHFFLATSDKSFQLGASKICFGRVGDF